MFIFTRSFSNMDSWPNANSKFIFSEDSFQIRVKRSCKVLMLKMHRTYGRSLSRGSMFPRLIDELYPSLSSSPDFSPRISIRRNLMHADSFLFIVRVAASINHALFNHFLRVLRESSHIPTTQACTLSFSYVTLDKLAEWGTNANDG